MASGLSKTKWHDTSLPTFNLPIADTSIDVDLSYQGKKSIPEILSTKKANVSLVWQGKTKTNRLYYGDNLSILANLLDDENIRGKVQLIYIDPPYATKGVFQTRSQKDAYSDLLEGSHYIEFIRERLILLRELLAPNGSIYVHLDENMAFYIKVIMDEVFGKNNFRNWITRKKCNPKNYTRKTYGDISDYILFYTKSDEYVWNRAYDKWTDEKALKEYSYVEETGRKYKKVPIHAPGTRNGETGKMWRGMTPPTGKHWQYTPETLDAMDARGEIFWSSTGNPRRKIYLDESEGIPAQDIWLDYKDAHNQNIEITGYPTEKNPNLLKRIIEASSNADDLVLDCFSGSGTTLEVASQLSRHWIGIDNSQEAIKTTLNRFAHGSEPMGDYVSKKKKTKTMPLFRITNFDLYSETERSKELNELVKQWREWIADN